MIIDAHAHYVPPSLFEEFRRQNDRFPHVVVEETAQGSYRVAFNGGEFTRPVPPKMMDLQQRLQWMDQQGIDVQVNAGWLDIFGYELPPDEGAEWSRFLNQHLWEAFRDNPRFVPLGTVPLQDGRRAAEVLREALDQGFPGVMIGTWINGRELDDPDLHPFWEAAAERQAVVYLHPVYAGGEERLAAYGLPNAVGRVNETTLAVSRLLYAGVVERFDGIRFVLSHGGGSIPWVLGRLARNYANTSSQMHDPVAGFQKLYFDSIVFDPDALHFLCRKAGPDRIVLGSDYPFPIGDLSPVETVWRADLGSPVTEMIMSGTAQKLFNIPVRG